MALSKKIRLLCITVTGEAFKSSGLGIMPLRYTRIPARAQKDSKQRAAKRIYIALISHPLAKP